MTIKELRDALQKYTVTSDGRNDNVEVLVPACVSCKCEAVPITGFSWPELRVDDLRYAGDGPRTKLLLTVAD